MPALRSRIVLAGPRVFLRRPTLRDEARFCAAARASRALHGSWVRAPSSPEAFAALLARTRRDDYESLLVCRNDDEALAGVFNLSEIVRGALESTYLGYYGFAPYVGQGYMHEGLALTLRFAFTRLKLHRVESNIQPRNSRSIRLVQRAGFAREGFSPRYLKIAGRWRDHERWALLIEDWRRRSRETRRGRRA